MCAVVVILSIASACPESRDDQVSTERVAAYRARIPELAEDDCQRHETLATSAGPACQAASTRFHGAVADLLAWVPRTWEKQILAIAGICRGRAYRFAQSELDRPPESELLVEGLEAAPGCLREQFALLEDVALREGVPLTSE